MEPKTKVVTVLGGGSFGTAMANIMADNGHRVTMWMRDQTIVDAINNQHENPRYLPDVPLNPAIKATSELDTCVGNADIILVAIPSKGFASVIDAISPDVREDQILVSTTKGIQIDSFKLMTQILAEKTCSQHIGALSGPNLANEIVAKHLTGTVIASESVRVREQVQQALSCEYFRVYANSDVFGVELAGALKNIYAIAAGLATANHIGQNTISMLITRGLAEMSRFANTLGANPLTFLGLAGVGDLFATCNSPLSRNFRVGQALAKGTSIDDIERSLGGVAEGIRTVGIVKQKAEELDVYMPLVSGLYEIIFNGKEVRAVTRSLMLGEHNSDVEFVLPGPHNSAPISSSS